jgi:uncharacterized protein (DUF342 family)
LKTGYDFYKAEKKEFLEKHIAEINKRLDYLNNMTGPAPASALSHSKLPERKHQIQRYIKEKRECLATLESYKNEFKSLEPSNSENSYSAIIVQKVLYKGVRLIIHNLEELVFETINGPLKLDENYIKL